MGKQAIDLTEVFQFENASYIEVEFAKRLNEQDIEYHVRQGMLSTSFPVNYYHVPTEHIIKAKEIYWAVQNESLINSEINQINKFKKMGPNEKPIFSSRVFMASRNKFFIRLLLIVASVLSAFLLFFEEGAWMAFPPLIFSGYLIYKILSSNFVKRLQIDADFLQLDNVKTEWQTIIYLDCIDESIKFRIYIINLILSDGSQYKIDPAMFGINADELINIFGMYYRRHL